mgnify:CR=1 FL=1
MILATINVKTRQMLNTDKLPNTFMEGIWAQGAMNISKFEKSINSQIKRMLQRDKY